MAGVKSNIFFFYFIHFLLSTLFPFLSSKNRKTITHSSNHPPGAKDIDMFINFLLLNKRRRQQQHTYMPLDTITITTLCTTYVGWMPLFKFLCMYKYSCDKTISIQLSIVVKVSFDAKVKTK